MWSCRSVRTAALRIWDRPQRAEGGSTRPCSLYLSAQQLMLQLNIPKASVTLSISQSISSSSRARCFISVLILWYTIVGIVL
ncbi:hypothetical protein PAXRUDRAFT_796732 [Paxillus rubicundulus Ve08.2h10]|uniref:Uncharacterized protein n=1 Tax=Paxillus rubicundulus Ve08.2h10 TaxID=930991 RepID=A0A0D0E3H2_9AGAM|nr:hypothetical protein PAXRUDRAFT_796732 [Paxillus rubicundulus Ve08.2h10]